MTSIRPGNEAELTDAVRALAAAGTPVAICGGSTKAKFGRPSNVETSLATDCLRGISLYEPSELVIGAKAGTPLSEVEKALEAEGQMLAFEPMDYGALLNALGEPTVGGIAAANISGPRRISAGACRDGLIGVRIVNGQGEVVKSGGRVMKNVTGLDLVKLVCGAWGTLGILSEVVFKVLPRPERTASVIIDGLEDNQAIAALSVALGSPFEVSGAAHIPRNVAPTPVTIIRVEGFDASVAYRLQKVATILKRFGDTRVLEGAASSDLWLRIRDVRWLAQPAHSAVWRLSLAPSAAAAVVAEVGQRIAIRHLYDWGGGLVWLAVDAPADAGAEIVRGAMRDKSGHATLVRAPEVLRATVDVYQPLPPALRKLTEGIKASFDPKRIFNPGRMYAGI